MRQRFGNGLDDAVVSPASAEVAAHAFADFTLVDRDNGGGEITGDDARDVALDFASHPDSGTELARCAISALKAIVLDKGLL